MSDVSSKPYGLFITLACITAFVSVFSAVLMTEPGQSLNLPRDWLISYYSNKRLLISLNVALLVALWFFHVKYRIWGRRWMVLTSIGVVFCIIAANFLLPAFFPSYQYGANYVSVQEADDILDDDSVIYAVEINGEVKGYPRKHLEIPHIAGASIGGEDVVMTFCALSNLPIVYSQDIGHGKSDLGILIQVHNNLLIVDRKSGELVQQITGMTEFSGDRVPAYSNDMMAWKVFKQIHPDALVFVYEFNRILDTLLLALFEGPMERQFSEEHGAVFPTIDLKDNRLPNKEQVWGLDLGNEQAAFTKGFLEKSPVHQFELGGKPLVIAHDKETDIVAAFDRAIDGTITEATEVDWNGNTPQGKLQKVPMQNGVFWMVWSHWFPDTEVYN